MLRCFIVDCSPSVYRVSGDSLTVWQTLRRPPKRPRPWRTSGDTGIRDRGHIFQFQAMIHLKVACVRNLMGWFHEGTILPLGVCHIGHFVSLLIISDCGAGVGCKMVVVSVTAEHRVMVKLVVFINCSDK